MTMVSAVNGHVNGASHEAAVIKVFPDAWKTLDDADPEVAAIVADEKARQW